MAFESHSLSLLYGGLFATSSAGVYLAQRASPNPWPGLAAGAAMTALCVYLAGWLPDLPGWARDAGLARMLIQRMSELLGLSPTWPQDALSGFSNLIYRYYLALVLLVTGLYVTLRGLVVWPLAVFTARWRQLRQLALADAATSRSRRRARIPVPVRSLGFAETLLANRSYRDAVAVVTLLMGGLVEVFIVLPGVVEMSSWTTINFGAISTIFWFGSYVLMLELWGAFRIAAPAEAPPSVPEALRTGRRSLARLFAAYRDQFGNGILFSYAHPRSESAAGATNPDTAAPAGAFEPLRRVLCEEYQMSPVRWSSLVHSLRGLIAGERNCVFAETLSRSHYAILAEIIQWVQDEGGTTVVICPERLAPQVEAVLEEEANRIATTTLVQRWHRVGRDIPNRSLVFNLVIIPEDRFEQDFLEKPDEFEREMRRLRLVVLLDLQNLDLAMLRLNLSRLQLVLSPGILRVICQGENLGSIEALTGNLFKPAERPGTAPVHIRPFTTLTLAEPHHADKYVLVWNDRQTTAQPFLERFLPSQKGNVEPLPLIMVPAWQAGFRVFHFDPEHRRNPQAWAAFQRKLAAEHIVRDLAGHLQSHLGHGSMAQDECQVVFVEDSSNLVMALQRNYNFQSDGEILINLLVQDYPLRDFLLHRLAEDDKAKKVAIDTTLLPETPMPSGGVTELVYILKQELLMDEGLSQQRLIHHLNLAPKGLLTHLRITPTRPGLARLFQLRFDRLPDIQADHNSFHEERYFISKPDAVKYTLRFHRRLIDADNKMHGMVPVADYGLSYAEGTLVQAEDQWYRIQTVTEDACTIEWHQLEADFQPSRPRYAFIREYALDFRPTEAALEDKAESSAILGTPAWIHTALIHACFQRRTIGFYAMDEREKPFGVGRPVLERQSLSGRAIRRHFNSILHLRLETIPTTWTANKEPCDLGRLAFTLCILLQDVIAAIFPTQAHRVAVLSPQAAAKGQTAANAPSRLDLFLQDYYPCLSELVGNPREIWRPGDSPAVSGAVATVDLDLFIVEDADVDLGVARAIQRRRGRVLRWCLDYARWLAVHDARADTFHRFGADEASAVLCFDAAANLLDHIIHATRHPST